MRDFNESDKKKKQGRIQITENPTNLSKETIFQLEDEIKNSSRDGHLPCGTAHRIAQDANVPKIAVGALSDKLGVRITNCQIGCFKVDKNLHVNLDKTKRDDNILAMLDTLNKTNKLDCAGVFEIAGELKLVPMAIADVANSHDLRIRHCQLGCF
jgi:hypothetical protein